MTLAVKPFHRYCYPMDPLLARGVDEFNAGKFFTAHETWEALWLETVGAEKLLLQGLVQIAAGYAKAETGVRGGALKLLGHGLERVRLFLSNACGLALEPFVAAVAADIERLRQAPEASVDLRLLVVPTLHRE